MNLPEPKFNIITHRNTEGNTQYVSIEVANEYWKDIVNSYSDIDCIKGDSIYTSPILPAEVTGNIIREGKLNGYFVVNKCYDVEEVRQFFESLGETLEHE